LFFQKRKPEYLKELGQRREAVVLATAPALLPLFIDITLSLQVSKKVPYLSLEPLHGIMFSSLHMSLVLRGRWLAEC